MICLQGGAEFGDDCRTMDSHLLSLAPPGPVVVVPLAADVGREYDEAGRHAVRYYGELGASEVVVIEDPRREGQGTVDRALTALRSAGLIVLPGGSPARLLDALRMFGLDLAVGEAHNRGALVMGASAGAMVLGARTVIPERGGLVVDALGLVPHIVVLPHFSARAATRLTELRAGLSEDEVALGIPEQSGLLVQGTKVTALGRAAPTFLGGRPFALAPGSQGLVDWELGWELNNPQSGSRW